MLSEISVNEEVAGVAKVIADTCRLAAISDKVLTCALSHFNLILVLK
jgi:hypothetical protein